MTLIVALLTVLIVLVVKLDRKLTKEYQQIMSVLNLGKLLGGDDVQISNKELRKLIKAETQNAITDLQINGVDGFIANTRSMLDDIESSRSKGSDD